MPQLALGDEDVTIVAWHKRPGEEVREGEPLLEVETEKASVDVESPTTGTVISQLHAPGAVIGSGTVIALIGDPGEEAPTSTAAEAAAEIPIAERPVEDAPPAHEPAMAPAALVALPERPALVKHGELRGLPWRWPPEGLSAAQMREHPPGLRGERVEILGKRRRAIARRLSEAAAIPQFATTREIRINRLLHEVEAARAGGVAVTLTDGFAITLAAAAARVPQVNAWLVEDELHVFESVSIAVAVDTQAGVVAPVIRDVDLLELSEIAVRRAELVASARNGSLTADDLEGATITLSNVGTLGADSVTPLITPPQVAVLGIGRGRVVGAQTLATFTFVADHRALDGADGARFLDAVAAILELADAA